MKYISQKFFNSYNRKCNEKYYGYNYKFTMVKIKVKQFSGKNYEVDIEPTSTIKDLKEKISSFFSISIPEQKLLFNRKILVDANTIQESCLI